MDSAELEKKVQILWDTEEIKKLHYQYINSLCFNDWDKLLDCFTEDSVVDLGEGEWQGSDYGNKEGLVTRGKPEDVTEALEHPEKMYMEGRELATDPYGQTQTKPGKLCEL